MTHLQKLDLLDAFLGGEHAFSPLLGDAGVGNVGLCPVLQDHVARYKSTLHPLLLPT